MKTPEEIKRGMVHCSNDSTFCNAKCPYFNASSNGVDCATEMHGNGLAYIQQLEQDNAQKDERIMWLEMMNAEYKHVLGYIKHAADMGVHGDADVLSRFGIYMGRGVEEDERGENH